MKQTVPKHKHDPTHPYTPNHVLSSDPDAGHAERAAARTRGTGHSQHKRLCLYTTVFVFSGALVKMTDIPISSSLGISVRGRAGTTGTRRPQGQQWKVTDPHWYVL